MADSGGLQITDLRLKNWRNFRTASIELAPRTFLVGPNASGKSNLLDAIRFLHDIVAVGGGFQDAVNNRGGVSSLRCLAARQQPDIELVLRLSGTGGTWTYQLSFNQTRQREPIVKREMVALGSEIIIERPNAEDRDDPARLSQTFLEQVNVNRDFRSIADLLRAADYRHIVPQIVRDPDRYTGKQNDPFGGDFLERIGATQERTRKARLRRITEALRVAVPQLQELRLSCDDRGVPHVEGRYEHWRPHGAWQSESDFSDGTLRLLGLLWSIMEGSGPLLLEEPELSLHPEVVRHIPPMLARMQSKDGRQVTLSTQSRELLHDEGIGLHEVFLLRPGEEGTEVTRATEFAEIGPLLDGGFTMGDAVMPHTRPDRAEQLSIFPSG